MTLTLLGRWQTRLFLLGAPGAIVTAAFAAFNARRAGTLFLVLLYVAAVGLAWDTLYNLLQKLRWDRDWPAVFQVGAGGVEGAVLYACIGSWGLPGIRRGSVPLGLFLAMYVCVWLVTFTIAQGPVRVFLPRWRFNGGRLL